MYGFHSTRILGTYRLDDMMTSLHEIHWAEDPPSCLLTDLNRMTLQLHACMAWESWPDSREYGLLLNVFDIKCNEEPNLTLIN